MSNANFKSGTVWTSDNLIVLRGMNSACVDLIYLDPPFNSNRTYEAPIGSKAAGASFKDAWTLDDVDVHEHGELADRNPAAYSVIEAAGAAHGKGMMAYLIFMAVRLLEMERILKPKCLVGYPNHQSAGKGADWLPYPKASGSAGTHRPSEQQQGRSSVRPVLRVCH